MLGAWDSSVVSIVRSSCIVVDSDDVLVVVVVAGDVVAVVKFSVSSSFIYVVVKTLLALSFIVFTPYKPLAGIFFSCTLQDTTIPTDDKGTNCTGHCCFVILPFTSGVGRGVQEPPL